MSIPNLCDPEKFGSLVRELGGDHVASRAARIIIHETGLTSVSDLRAWYDSAGPVVFTQELSDFRRIGPVVIARVTEKVLAMESP